MFLIVAFRIVFKARLCTDVFDKFALSVISSNVNRRSFSITVATIDAFVDSMDVYGYPKHGSSTNS